MVAVQAGHPSDGWCFEQCFTHGLELVGPLEHVGGDSELSALLEGCECLCRRPERETGVARRVDDVPVLRQGVVQRFMAFIQARPFCRSVDTGEVEGFAQLRSDLLGFAALVVEFQAERGEPDLVEPLFHHS